MPVYSLECQDCCNQWDMYFHMDADKTSPCPNCQGRGKRVWTVPTMSIDAKISPFDLDAMTKKTGQMKGGTIGSLWDMAAEASQQREQILGKEDPIKKKALEDYAKKRKGKKYKDTKQSQSIDVEIRRT